MLVKSSQLPQVWQEISLERAASAEKSLVVLHSISEVDSCCATRLVMQFLDQNCAKSSFYPVNDFRDLREALADVLQGSTEERTVVMINCGATCYVKQLLEEGGINAVNVRFLVIDSHRPVDARYNNNEDVDYLLLLDEDDPFGPEAVPAFDALDEMTEEDYGALVEEADGPSDDEGDDGSGDEGGPTKRQKSHAEASPSGARAQARELLRRVNIRKAELDEYYNSGSCYGKPAALSALALIEQSAAGLAMGDIWPAIVGLTDQHVHQRVSRHHYDCWYMELREKLATIAARPEYYTDEDGTTRALPSYAISISPADDFRLMLYRHWTLYEAMQYSPYVAPRMQTWREGGLNRMQMIFVNMGLSLEQAKVAFSTMAPAHKNLSEKLPAACRNTALSPADMAYRSFELKYGFGWLLSASDAVHALTGLMVRHAMIGGTGPGGGGGNGNGAGGQLSPEEIRSQQFDAARDDFWDALSALNVTKPNAFKLLKEGIEEAKALQKAVIKDGGLMITRRQLEANPAHHMQELNLQAIRPTNSDRFRHPLALLRLATFVRDAADVARTGRKNKWPLAVVGPDDGSGYCCIMGIRHKQLPKQPQYNIFGIMFQQVLQEEADTLKWDQERDGFDTAVVYVHRDSVPTFMTELKIRLGQQARAAAEAAAAATQQQTQAEAQRRGGGDDAARRRAAAAADSPARSKRRGQEGMEDEEGADADAIDTDQ